MPEHPRQSMGDRAPRALSACGTILPEALVPAPRSTTGTDVVEQQWLGAAGGRTRRLSVCTSPAAQPSKPQPLRALSHLPVGFQKPRFVVGGCGRLRPRIRRCGML